MSPGSTAYWQVKPYADACGRSTCRHHTADHVMASVLSATGCAWCACTRMVSTDSAGVARGGPLGRVLVALGGLGSAALVIVLLVLLVGAVT